MTFLAALLRDMTYFVTFLVSAYTGCGSAKLQGELPVKIG
jgi:hypothetical protein